VHASRLTHRRQCGLTYPWAVLEAGGVAPQLCGAPAVWCAGEMVRRRCGAGTVRGMGGARRVLCAGGRCGYLAQ